MSDHPIIFSIVTGKPSQRGKHLKAKDGLTWRQRNKEAVAKRRRELYALNPEKYRQRQSEERRKNANRVNAYNRRWGKKYRTAIRAEMISAYGGVCVCCGEKEPRFLELDHIHNDGAAARRKHQTQFAEWLFLRRNNWPKENHQLLCANCNKGKLMNGGICPHQTQGQ